jgi:hypothetical protein
MADLNAKIDVKRNGRGQIISYEVENTATYSPILLSNVNRQLLKKYGKRSFLDNVDVEIKEFTQLEILNASVQIPVPATVTSLGNVTINLSREIDLQYVANIDSNTIGNTTTGTTTAVSNNESSGNSSNNNQVEAPFGVVVSN